MITLDRFLISGDTLAGLLDDDRLVMLARARGERPMRWTLRLREPADSSTVTAWVRAFVERASSPATARGVEVVTAAPQTSLPDVCAAHDALVPCGAPDDGPLIVSAWQHGLCVINAAEQAARAAVFEDEYFEPSGAPSGQRWYSLMEGSPVVITNPRRIVLEYGARINPRVVVSNEGAITIGRGSLLGADAELNVHTARFTMGRFCHTSSYFTAVGSRHTLHFPSTFAVSRGPYAFLGEPADLVGDIEIGNDVWFGTRVALMPGVSVADGCVVGAGSVVTRSLTEPYGIYAGNPARLLRFRFPPHVVKWLRAIQWWNWPTRRLWEASAFFRTDLSTRTEDELWRLIAR